MVSPLRYGYCSFIFSNIKERTRDALAQKRKRGEKTGGSIPFGYDVVEEGVNRDGEPIKKLIPTKRKSKK